MENCLKSKDDLVRELQDARGRLAAFQEKRNRMDSTNINEEQDRRLKQLLLAMRGVNQLIVRENDPKKLIRQGCEYLTQTFDHCRAWIALLDDTGAVEAMEASGFEHGFENLKKQVMSGAFSPCMTKALEKQGPLMVDGVHQECCFDCSVECEDEERIAMACQIRYGKRIYGIVVVSMPERIAFNEEERKFFNVLAQDLGFALYKIEAEKIQREQEHILSAVYQDTPMIMILLDGQRRVRRINRLACEYLGRPASEMIGKPCGEVLRCMHNQNDPKGCGYAAFCTKCEVRLTVVDTLETGRNHHHVEAVLPYDVQGREKNLTLLLYTTRLQFQKQHMVLVTILDISERKSSELALKESEQLFRSLIEGAPDAVFVQTENRFSYLNTSSVSLFGGESAGQFIGEEWTDRFHPDYRQSLTEHMQGLIRKQKPVHSLDQICLRLDGNQIPVEVSAVPITFRGMKAALVFVRDITERKRVEKERCLLEQQIRQAQRLESLGVLAGGIAHDFNNILMVVMGHAELALDKISHMPAACDNIREIVSAAQRASDLCRQMLAYAGKAPAVFGKIDLSELIGEMERYFNTLISKKTTLNLHLERGLLPVHADPGQIRQIIMNLILNASEAIGDQSGIITVKTGVIRCDEDFLHKTALKNNLVPGIYIYLEVSDTGCGIEADKKEHIFDPFFSTKFTGRGLGLAAVMGIVQAHKGAIQVCSEPGKGTTFKIYFPAMETNGKTAVDQSAS